MPDMSARCVRRTMFGFNLLFVITGLTLIITGGIAESNHKLLPYLNLTVTAPALLIVVGVFIFVIAFLGCCGAIRENYHMLVGFAVLLSVIFVLQLSGGIAAAVQKDNIATWLQSDLKQSVENYYKDFPNTKLVDHLQSQLRCCGLDSYKEYKELVKNHNTTTVPESCCRATSTGQWCTDNRDTLVLAQDCQDPDSPACPIYTRGCRRKIENYLESAISGVAGAAIGLAFVELIGIVFACFLARRVKNGYTYA